MPKFTTYLTETYATSYEVEADSLEQAYDKAYEIHNNGDVEAAVAVEGAKFISSFIDCEIKEEANV